MNEILLVTLNAKYPHSAFGLRYLYANLGEFKERAQIIEFTISENAHDIAEKILALSPTIVGFGVYIWNTRETQEVVSILKRVRPELKVVLGGPEVSYETESQPICQLADLTIQGEGDFLFYEVCRDYLNESKWPGEASADFSQVAFQGRKKVNFIRGILPEIKDIKLPYRLYSDSDIQNRVIYVEASRGCPYKCEYCLSSLDKSVRSFDLKLFLGEMDLLIQRGARQFKFIDRTFNLSMSTSSQILQFFLDKMNTVEGGLFLHFEMVPDRLPIELRDLIRKFPLGSLQFEIGIQTWNPEVSKLVSRRQDYAKIKENFAFLREDQNVHTHADLIAGLPGETLESFARGFDAVAELGADEIQVGILKRLKGTPIIRHDQEWAMVYEDNPPFQVLQTRTLSFQVLRGIARFSKFWDLIANSGNFVHTMGVLKGLAQTRPEPSLYWEFNQLSEFMHTRHPQGHGIALLKLMESVYVYLTAERGQAVSLVRETMLKDYVKTNRSETPHFLRTETAEFAAKLARRQKSAEAFAGTLSKSNLPDRQKRHLKTPAAADVKAESSHG